MHPFQVYIFLSFYDGIHLCNHHHCNMEHFRRLDCPLGAFIVVGNRHVSHWEPFPPHVTHLTLLLPLYPISVGHNVEREKKPLMSKCSDDVIVLYGIKDCPCEF